MQKQVKVVHEKVVNKGGDAVYALGLFGALFYFLQQAVTFQDYIFAIIKALLWPAFLIYSHLSYLNV